MTTIYVGQNEECTDIQSGINKSKKNDTVFVKSGKYNLNAKKIIPKSDIKLIGEDPKTTTIFGSQNSGGFAGIKGTSDGWVYCRDISNFVMSGFNFASTAGGTADGGHGDNRNCVYVRGCKDVIVDNCLVTKYVYNDFVRISKSKNVTVKGCSGQAAHDFVSILSGTDTTVIENCDISVQTNTGIRVDNSLNTTINNNNFTGQKGTGWCLIELENTVTNCDIFKNIFHDYRGSSGNNVTQPVHVKAINVTVKDNVMWDVGKIAIGSNNNNIVNPTDINIQNWISKGYGVQKFITDEVDNIPELAVDFTATVLKGKAPLKTRFNAIVTGNPTEYLWTFEPNTSSDYCSTQPLSAGHTFKKPGIYTVTLDVQNGDKVASITKRDYITVT